MKDGSDKRTTASLGRIWAGVALRVATRFVGSVAAVSGSMLVIEAGVTVVWQEPISALIAARAQASLDKDLEDLSKGVAWERILEVGGSDEEVVDRLATLQRAHAETSEAVGRIELPTLDGSFAVVEGTDVGTLRKGPGHYEDTPLPGEGGTFAVAGHRTTYLAPFRDINQLTPGDPLIIDMPYAKFTYLVEKTAVVLPEDTWVKDSVGRDRLVLTACHPAYSEAKRIVIFADLDRFEIASAVRQAQDQADT